MAGAPRAGPGRRLGFGPDFLGRSALARHGVGLAAVAAAAAVAWALRAQFDSPVLPLFVAAAAVAAWWGGLGPALLACVASMAAVDVVFPVGPPGNVADELPRLAVLLAASLVAAALGASQRRTEAALRASEHRFRTMVDVAGEGVVLVDPEGTVVYANDRFGELLGHAGPLAGESLWDHLAPEDVPGARDALGRARAERLPPFVVRVRRDDGDLTPVLVASSPVRDEAAGLTGVLAMLTDLRDRQQAARELDRANERFRLAAEAVEAMIYDWDLATDRVERSRGLLPLLGWEPGEVPPVSAWWTAQIHPDDRERYLRDGLPATSTPPRYDVEYRVRHRDGRWLTVLEQGRLVGDADDRPVRVVGSVVDITRRRQDETGLQLLADAGEVLSSGQGLGTLVARVAELAVPGLADWCAVDLVDADGVLRRQATACRPGLPEAAVPDLGLARACLRRGLRLASPTAGLAPGDAEPDPAAEEARAATGASAVLALPLRARDLTFGTMTLLWVDGVGGFFPTQVRVGRALARRSALAIDNARLHHEMQEAEGRYRGLFESATDAILVIDRHDRVVDANPAAVRLLGRDRAALLRARAADLDPEGRAWSGPELDRLVHDGAWHGEVDLRAGDGRTVPVEARVDPVRLPGGTLWVATLRDIAEQRALARAQEAFVDSVAHDLRNPLTAIRGNAQLLRRRLARDAAPDPARLGPGIEGIETGAARIADLIDELVDAARVRSGRAPELRRGEVDLVALARQAVAVHQRATDRHTVVLVADEPSLLGRWDRSRLERVLGNLLVNAIKYSPDGGTVTVRVAREAGPGGPAARLEVSDEGVGIPVADVPRVFDRFHRAANVGSIAGTGLGLPGVRQIVEGHGGTVTVASREGEGSTFVVRLPLADESGGREVEESGGREVEESGG